MTILFDEDIRTTASAAVVARGTLLGPSPASQHELQTYLAAHGGLPAISAHAVVQLAVDSGLAGHGGAGFPLYRKLEAVIAARGRAIVVANGAEGEPASAKDRWLLARRPHLVLDGLQLVARATNAADAFLYVNHRLPVTSLDDVLSERRRAGLDPVSVTVVAAPDAFISGEETAVVSHLSGGAAIPRFKSPRVTERGVRGRPTLVSNVETLALLALIARRGAAWFRTLGTANEPGTMLLTVGGAVHAAGIVETGHGTPLADVLALAGGASTRLQAVLLGGYHGTWLAADEVVSAKLSRSDLAPFGASPGAGVMVALGAGTCGLVEMSRVMSYLAEESAGQCGPCLNGLPRIATQLKSVAFTGGTQQAIEEMRRLAGMVVGRGACHHPDGSMRFLHSGLRVFAAEVELHVAGHCSRTSGDAVLPTAVTR
jgi:NADH:ubiquinone oxidoreductase subunit F (NADH-binding)